MGAFFIRIYDYFEKHRWALFLSFAVVFAAAAFFASRVQFEEDISKILPNDKKAEKLTQVFQNSKFAEKLVVAVSLKDSNAVAQPDSLVAFADALVNEVQEKLSPYIGKISYRVDDSVSLQLFETVSNHLPVYLTDKDYNSIDSLIEPAAVKQTLERNIRTLTSPAGFALKNIISQDPVGISMIGLQKLQQLQYDENFELYDSYVLTKDHKHLLLFITPAYPASNTGKNMVLLQGLDSAMNKLYTAGYGNVDAGYFGAAAVSAGNAQQLRRDTLFTQGITVVFLILFIGFYFRKKRAPLTILVPVVFGALFSLAAIYFIKGSISVIALGTGSVILGIAVNYSLHVFNHYRHTRNVRQVIGDLAFPLTVGSFTTIGGFFCLEFVELELLRDLGLFAGFSLIGACLCSLLFLPHVVGSRKEAKQQAAPAHSFIDRLASFKPEHNRWFILGIIALTIVFAYKAGDVSFESDLLNMNYMPAKLKQAEARLNRINEYSLRSVYLVTEGPTLNEALINNERLTHAIEGLHEQNIVKKYSGVSSLIMSDSLQLARIAKWNAYWTPEKKQQLLAVLEKEGLALKFKPAAFDRFRALLNTNFQAIDAAEMSVLRKSFLDDYITENPDKSVVVTLLKVAPENKPAVYATFENNPQVTVIDRQYLTARFVEIINTDFTSIALMTSILVFSVLLITYGRIELALVSFVPMAITWIWILGIMALLGIQFNIINIIISTLIFALGDDYSLFIMDGLLQEYKTGKKNLSSFKSSIFLSAITTVSGLGVLIFAKHPALQSIALISIIGILCVVLISQVMIPYFFNMLIRNRVKKKHYPWTFSGFFISIFAFTYFVVGSIILTLLGILFVKLNPFNKEKGKYIYHFFVSKYVKSLVYVCANLRKVIVNPLKEDFSKPAVVICNHQSFLDILVTVMLHPKLILLTNKWVWRSPVFGWVVRMADYYPVAEGAENSIDMLADRVKEGYSIVVFPEGTRTVDGTMKRFHKGAFYIAEKLNLDILPIVLAGTGYTMTKGDFLLKNGTLAVKFLPRIKPGDTRFGTGYAENSKFIGRYFREQFQQFRQQIEQPAYFKELLIYNYLYKGPVIEWYMKVKLRLEKNYRLFNDLLPKQGNILDAGCGYGFLSYMLYFTSTQRQLTGIDYDEEKITVANHCFSRNEHINFEYADISKFVFGRYDGIVLSDVLHYLQPEQQKLVIERCITSLNPGGTIIIRDGNVDLGKRHKGTRMTEVWSTRIMGFNKTTGHGLSYLSGSVIKEAAAKFNMDCTEIDNARFTSNMLFIIKHPQPVHETV
jgi:1-acyl-sn-glycerol-3-phosphate acyltransferase